MELNYFQYFLFKYTTMPGLNSNFSHLLGPTFGLKQVQSNLGGHFLQEHFPQGSITHFLKDLHICVVAWEGERNRHWNIDNQGITSNWAFESRKSFLSCSVWWCYATMGKTLKVNNQQPHPTVVHEDFAPHPAFKEINQFLPSYPWFKNRKTITLIFI